MKHVLVAESLTEFLQAQTLPSDVVTVTFPEHSIPAGDAEGLIPTVACAVTSRALSRLTRLRVIANYGVGYDNIDMATARERGIVVSNTPGVLTDATAELTWALILAVARHVGEGERMVRAHAWPGWAPTQLRGVSLRGKTLGIVGAGRIGREVGRRADAFGMSVLYWNRTNPDVSLDELLARSDVVSIHLSKSQETENLIDSRALARMKDRAILINTARGAIVHEDALIEELKTGRLSAGLDVYVGEPKVNEALLHLENVVLLPHIGSATHEARQAMWDLAWENCMRGIGDERLLTPVE